MKRVWKLSLGLSLGLLVTRAGGEEIQWRPASPRTPSPVQATENLSLVQPPSASTTPPPLPDLGVPAIATTEPSGTPLRSAVMLERPVPVRPVAVVEPPVVRPTGFVGPSDTSMVVRGQGPDAPRAMPVGPNKDDVKVPAPAENVLKMPTPLPSSPVPTPLPTAPLPGPIADGIVIPNGKVPDGIVVPNGRPVGPEIVSSSPSGAVQGPMLGGEVFQGEVYDGEMVDGCGDGCCGEGCCGDCCCEEGVVMSPFRRWGGFGGMGGHGKTFGWHDSNWGDGWGSGWGWGDEGTGEGERFYIRGESLFWSISQQDVPPLITGSLRRGLPAGRLGAPGTLIAFGGGEVGVDSLNGGRFTGGWWFGPGKRIGFEGSGLFLGPESVRSSFGTRGFPGVFRPFFNVTRGEDALRIAFPRQAAGVSIVDLTTQMSGAEANFLFKLHTGECCRLVFLGGYRHLSLDDSLQITDHVRGLPRNTPTTLRIDRFLTENNFHGGQVGLQADLHFRRLAIGLSGKLGIGGVNETVDISGATLVNNGRRIRTLPGGLLAMPSNSGRFTANRFALLPEFGVTVGYQLTDWMKLYAGYNLLCLGNVVRPGNQVDRMVNPTQIMRRPRGGAAPILPFDTTEFFAHGVTAGLEFKY